MFSRSRPHLALVLPVFLLAVLVSNGCSTDAPVAPSADGSASTFSDGVRLAADLAAPADPRGGPRANLRNIWPNEDGRRWSYRIDQREWTGNEPRVFATEAEVPPIPSFDDVAALLGNHPIGSNPVAESGGYALKFNGTKTTLSGATGQNLESSFFDLADTSARLLADVAGAASGAETAGFIRALARARPDLREKIEGRWPDAARTLAPAGISSVYEPLFLFGNAFVKTREYIGSYGDLNLDLSWKYLESDLRPGSEFSMQLIPDLADNVFLHVRVLRESTVETAIGSLPHSIVVLYRVDYGVSEVTNELGDPIGWSRYFGYGTITYAPRVGPVASYERPLVQVGLPLDPGYHDQTISLRSVLPGSAIAPPAP